MCAAPGKETEMASRRKVKEGKREKREGRGRMERKRGKEGRKARGRRVGTLFFVLVGFFPISNLGCAFFPVGPLVSLPFHCLASVTLLTLYLFFSVPDSPGYRNNDGSRESCMLMVDSTE